MYVPPHEVEVYQAPHKPSKPKEDEETKIESVIIKEDIGKNKEIEDKQIKKLVNEKEEIKRKAQEEVKKRKEEKEVKEDKGEDKKEEDGGGNSKNIRKYSEGRSWVKKKASWKGKIGLNIKNKNLS